jgi:hypothetical protein
VHYVLSGLVWTVVGLVTGVGLGYWLGTHDKTEKERKHFWDLLVGGVLMLLGLGLVTQQAVQQRRATEERECLGRISTSDVSFEVRQTDAVTNYLHALQQQHLTTADPKADPVVEAYLETLRQINQDRQTSLGPDACAD